MLARPPEATGSSSGSWLQSIFGFGAFGTYSNPTYSSPVSRLPVSNFARSPRSSTRWRSKAVAGFQRRLPRCSCLPLPDPSRQMLAMSRSG